MLVLMTFFVLFYAIFASIFGGITYAIGHSKGLKYSFWWGFGLGLIGIIVVLCLEPSKEQEVVVKSNSITKEEKLETAQESKEQVENEETEDNARKE